MAVLRSEATKVFGRRHAKRNVLQLVLFVALAFFWWSSTTTTITINTETRQVNQHVESSVRDDEKLLTFTSITHDTVIVGNHSTLDDSFNLKNINVSKRVPCGANKCFFRLKTDPTVGYLVQPDVFRYDKHTTPEQLFKTLEISWELAQELQKKYDIKHFLLEPPTKVNITKKLAKQLNSNIWSEARGVQYDTERFPRGSTAFIQKVRLAPEPNLIIGCTSTKRGQFERNVDTFLTQVNNKESFARDFAENMRVTRILLEKETCLFKDFQVLLDTDGQLYHLDFDRCFSSADQKRRERKSLVNSCLRTLDSFERQVKQILSGSEGSSSTTN